MQIIDPNRKPDPFTELLLNFFRREAAASGLAADLAAAITIRKAGELLKAIQANGFAVTKAQDIKFISHTIEIPDEHLATCEDPEAEKQRIINAETPKFLQETMRILVEDGLIQGLEKSDKERARTIMQMRIFIIDANGGGKAAPAPAPTLPAATA